MAAIVRPTLTFYQERGTRDGSANQTQFGMGANSGTRPVWVDWVDRYKAARAIIGYSQLDRLAGIIIGLRRLTPLPHPDAETAGSDDGPGNMFATRINGIKGYKALAGTSSTLETAVNAGVKKNVFEKAEIEIMYENPGYQVRTEEEIENWPEDEYLRMFEVLEPTPSSSYITLPGGCMNYIRESGTDAPHGLPVNYNVGKVFSTMQLKFMWHRLPYDLFDISNQTNWAKRIYGDPDNPDEIPLIGTVNKTAWLSFPAGTLLLENVRPIPVKSPFYYIWEWNFEITWNYNPRGWNYLYYFSPAGGAGSGTYFVGKGTTYYAPGSVPDNTSIYNEREHSLVLNVRDVP